MQAHHSPLPESRNLEVEVKFLVSGLPVVRTRLVEVGAELVAPRVYERNVRYDTPDGELLKRLELLRLRQDTRVRLTFKGPAAEDELSEAKVREEIEVGVTDYERMDLILRRLGFLPVQAYEKYRESYHWRDIEIVLDELPFGEFVELEGAEANLKSVAAALGLDWGKRVTNNYLEMMKMCRRAYDLPFSDLTFADFKGRPVDMSRLLPLCIL